MTTSEVKVQMPHMDTVDKARTLDSAKQRVNIFRNWPEIVRVQRVRSRGRLGDDYVVEWVPKAGQPCPFRSYPDGTPCTDHWTD